MEQFEKNDNYDVISDNMSRTDETISHGLEMRIAHLKDLSAVFSEELRLATDYEDVMDAVCLGEEVPGLYEEKISFVPGNSFGQANEGEYGYYKTRMADSDKIRFAKLLSDISSKNRPEDIIKWLSGEEPKGFDGNARIATTTGKQINEAFKFFATKFENCTPVESDNFFDVCEAVSKGEADYGIIPVSNTIDGRLSAFCSFIEKAQLYIVMTTLVDSSDGENTTEFAMVSSSMKIDTDGEKCFRIRITLDEYSDLDKIFSCAIFNGAKIQRTDILPQSVAGRENSLDIILDVTSTDLRAIICYLKLNFPQFTTLGIYSVNGGNL